MADEGAKHEEMRDTDIAVVGRAARLPGAATPDQFWRNLHDGIESIRTLSDSELRAAGVDPALLHDAQYVKRAAVLDEVDGFDAGFFGFSPKDAAIMDPQHRHFLEVAWAALEDAGHPPERFDGAVGVFAGCGAGWYLSFNLLSNPELVDDVGLFLLRHTANDKDFLPTRVSYELDLHGPSVAVQTACSTSLVAIHLAAQSLIAGECDMALAGGVTIEIPHGRGYRYEEGEILAPDGRCRAFDADAAGTVFGSGAGVVVLRRLEDALRDGDTIHAVVRGSAVNNDGSRKVGFLAPSVDGQIDAISEAIAYADVDPATVTYIEAHGTGTPVGDPIEVQALRTAYGPGRRWLGSVKPNIGHLDTAAGVASFLKVVEALKHGQVPPTVHFTTPNPLLGLDEAGMAVNGGAVPWERAGDAPRRAGVSSLGVGGTNAHVIVQEAPPQASGPSARPLQLLTLSARTEAAVRTAGTNLAAFLTDPAAAPDLADAAYTLHVGRRAFERRLAVVAADAEEAADALRTERRPVGTAIAERPVVFMLPGGGAQRPGMGAELYQAEPAYRAAVDECLAALPDDLAATLRRLTVAATTDGETDGSELERPLLSVLSVFVADYAMAQLWRSWGVEAAALIGHSLGEWVAACLAGVISLPDALRLVQLRGEIFERLDEGGIVSILLPEDEVRRLLVDGVDIATVNGPDTCAVSGRADALAAFEDVLTRAGATFQRVAIAVAPHSPLLDAHLDEFEAAVAAVELHPPKIPYASNLTGRLVTDDEATDPASWRKQLRHVVRFWDGLQAVALDDAVLLEVGPGDVLTGLAKAAGTTTAIASQRREEQRGELAGVLVAAGDLWAAGAELDWASFHRGEDRRRISLPTYPFEHARHWIEPGLGRTAPAAPKRQAVARESLYRRTWRPLAPVELGADRQDPGTWLVLTDTRVGPRLVKQLDELGHRVVTVTAGDAWRNDADDEYSVDPRDPESFEALFDALEQSGAMPTHAVGLWLLDADDDTALAQRLGFDGLLHLVQGWAGERLVPPRLRLAVATNGAQALDGENVRNPGHALALGPVRVAPRELPELSARAIDVVLDVDATEDDVDRLAADILAEARSTDDVAVVALRDGRRFGEDLEAVAAPGGDIDSRLRPGGVYLITGGLGALGLAHARHLAAAVGARLVLLGRTGLPPEDAWDDWVATHGAENPVSDVIGRLREIEAAGGEVLVAAADVTDRDQLRAVVAEATDRFGPLNGVIHGAGAVDDAPLQLKRVAASDRVLAPKVAGTEALLEAVADQPLDFVALFSSASSVLAPAGQVDYAAANSFLNAVAATGMAFPVVAINWTSWRGAGMATRALAAATGAPAATAAGRATGHPLLGTCLAEAADGAVFEADLDPEQVWVLDEHRLADGTAVLPGAAYIEMARAAAHQLRGDAGVEIRDLVLLAPLAVAPGHRRPVRVELWQESDGLAFTVSSVEGAGSVVHARARLAPLARRLAPIEIPDGGNPSPAMLHQEGRIRFGPRWHGLDRVRGTNDTITARLRLDADFAADVDVFGLHPALVDLAINVGLSLADDEGDRDERDAGDRLFVPAGCARIAVAHDLPAEATTVVRRRPTEPGAALTVDIDLVAPDGTHVAIIEGFSLAAVDATAFTAPPVVAHHPPVAPPADSADVERLARWTAAGIDADLGTEAFTLAISALGVAEIIVSPIDPAELLEELKPVAPAPVESRTDGSSGAIAPRTETERVLARLWSDLLGVADISVTDSFFDLGGHSLLAARLFARINKQFGTTLGLATLLEAPTVEQLAAIVDPDGAPLGAGGTGESGTATTRTWTSLVPLHKDGEGGRPPFFAVHPVGGNVVHFFDMARHLRSGGWPVWALQAQGVDGRHPLHRSVEEMATHYIAEMRELQPSGPYFIGGASFGGVVCWEMAQQLHAMGEEVAALAMFDTWGPGYPKKLPSTTAFKERTGELRYRVALHSHSFRISSGEARKEWLTKKVDLARRRTIRKTKEKIQSVRQDLQRRQLPAHLREVEKIGLRADKQYEPQPYPGKAILFRATQQPPGIYEDKMNGWEGYAVGGLEIHHVPGFHGAFMEEPGVQELAPVLIACLDEAWEDRR